MEATRGCLLSFLIARRELWFLHNTGCDAMSTGGGDLKSDGSSGSLPPEVCMLAGILIPTCAISPVRAHLSTLGRYPTNISLRVQVTKPPAWWCAPFIVLKATHISLITRATSVVYAWRPAARSTPVVITE